MSYKLVIKDAARQLIGRVASALLGFVVIKIMAPYLWPLQYGDYSTILKYFAIWTALADFGLYVLAIRQLGVAKELEESGKQDPWTLSLLYGKFVGTRAVTMIFVYTTAIVLAYFLPAYTSNPYIARGLPIGMLFSASFMRSGITQIPLQIFRKMKQLSIWLILARIAQLILLSMVVFRRFPKIDFSGDTIYLLPFLLVLLSVLLSGVVQRIYVEHKANKILRFRVIIDRNFIRKIFTANWQYGIAYYLSSFHTLIVLILLSNFFPTIEGNDYTGIWALALSLIEILLIIPSSLGNSLLHKIANYNHTNIRKSFGALMSIIIWIGWIVFLNFWIFADPLILAVSWPNFIGSSLLDPGSNTILPFLAFVLWLSFIKQIFNYLFVAIHKNNDILWVNLIGIIVGLAIGLYAIPRYALVGGIITQLVLEVMYVLGAVIVAIHHRALPFIYRRKLLQAFALFILAGWLGYYFLMDSSQTMLQLIIWGLVFNIPLIALSIPIIKRFGRGLTID